MCVKEKKGGEHPTEHRPPPASPLSRLRSLSAASRSSPPRCRRRPPHLSQLAEPPPRRRAAASFPPSDSAPPPSPPAASVLPSPSTPPSAAAPARRLSPPFHLRRPPPLLLLAIEDTRPPAPELRSSVSCLLSRRPPPPISITGLAEPSPLRSPSLAITSLRHRPCLRRLAPPSPFRCASSPFVSSALFRIDVLTLRSPSSPPWPPFPAPSAQTKPPSDSVEFRQTRRRASSSTSTALSSSPAFCSLFRSPFPAMVKHQVPVVATWSMAAGAVVFFLPAAV